MRATARVFEVAPTTGLAWLVDAAEQLRAFSASFLCEVHVKQLQLDELYAVLREVKAGALTENDAIERLERSRYWVWTAMDPESKLLLLMDVGPRTLAMAQRVVHHVAEMLAPACVPLWVTDGRHMWADTEVHTLHKRCVDLPAQRHQHLIDGLERAEDHAVRDVDEAPTPRGLDHLRVEQL